jgi:hypothetical protein
MKTLCSLCLASLLLLAASPASSAVIQFDLQGTGGFGLLPSNEPGTITGGTGGEIGAGISYDDVTNILSVNIGWGSSQGFIDLSSASNNSHIHGPTASNNGSGFTQTAGVFATLTRSSSLATGGTTIQTVAFPTAQNETDLLNGKFYINIHTANNGGGEMRGFLVAVPEPSRAMLGMMGIGFLAFRRSRKAHLAA